MKPNVLYIEDHPDNLMLVRRILRPESYNLMEANTGIQGITIAETCNIDIILLDINLPDIDGYEVARRLRASAKTELSDIPIIAVTANAMKGDANKAISAGCNFHMTKPIDVQSFLEQVDSSISKKLLGVRS
jgi:two-component system cell cycle response regulator DivK